MKINSVGIAALFGLGLSLLAQPFLFPVSVHAQKDDPIVVLSPGHGQLAKDGVTLDPGADYKALIEKDINLEVARHARDFLERCDVEVHLTRNGDDREHTLVDVTEIVESYNPTLAVAIHTNSDEKIVSGTEGWYTVGGFDDAISKKLARQLSQRISDRFGIRDRGAKPETSNRHGGLYIHDWDVPSALIELAYLQGDYGILKENQKEFGRVVARAILEHLGIPPTCADNAVVQDIYFSTYFPSEIDSHTVRILNDGVVPWERGDYELISLGETYGAAESYPLPGRIMPGEVTEWEIPIEAPSSPGAFQQEWQVHRGDDGVGKVIKVYMLVFPQEARDLKEDVEKQIEEAKQKGEQAVEDLFEELKRKAVEWFKEKYVDPYVPELPDDCPPIFALLFIALIVRARK